MDKRRIALFVICLALGFAIGASSFGSSSAPKTAAEARLLAIGATVNPNPLPHWTVITQDKNTITYGWTPPPTAIGYYFFVDATLVSNTKSGLTNTVKFAKPCDAVRVCKALALDPGESSSSADLVTTTTPTTTTTPPTTTAPPPAGSSAAYDVKLTPNYLSHQDDPASNYQGIWIYPKSPTTPYLSPDSQAHVQRYMLLDPRVKDALGNQGNDDWWFVIQRYWPSAFDPNQHGQWGMEDNFHNVAGDAGPGGGVGWGFGDGVSALSLNWLPGAKSPEFLVEPAPQGDYAMPIPTRDAWHTYVVHWIAGRIDGTTLHPGALTIWADGTQVTNAQGINTVQRALASDGNSYTQQWLQLWEGDYTRALQAPSTYRLALTRVGSTLAQAVADNPVIDSTNEATEYYSGVGTNSGPPSITAAGVAPAPVVPVAPPPPVTTTTATTTTTPTTTSTPTTTTAPTTTATPPPVTHGGTFAWNANFESGKIPLPLPFSPYPQDHAHGGDAVAADSQATIVPAPAGFPGTKAVQLRVGPDPQQLNTKHKGRAQVNIAASYVGAAEGKASWYDFCVRFPSGSLNTGFHPWTVVQQFGNALTSPFVSIDVVLDAQQNPHLEFDTLMGSSTAPHADLKADLGQLLYDKTYCFSEFVKWSRTKANGQVELIMNGQVAVPLRQSQTLLTDQGDNATAFNLDIYRFLGSGITTTETSVESGVTRYTVP